MSLEERARKLAEQRRRASEQRTEEYAKALEEDRAQRAEFVTLALKYRAKRYPLWRKDSWDRMRDTRIPGTYICDVWILSTTLDPPPVNTETGTAIDADGKVYDFSCGFGAKSLVLEREYSHGVPEEWLVEAAARIVEGRSLAP